ncbi:PREDICTED: phylloplanin-like [Tarenaya hassleriana]|uniref:phylloplanin-like n=1 Tax=Tarenaya hassleriana TaxID=28532 RepID=UPI00053C94C4|nr:PREDICTED: phylloplanin-like [Tarenaya hassleriana]
MANSSILLIISTILLLLSFSSLSHGLKLNGLEIGSVRINGLLYCSVNGNLIRNSAPLPGALVSLSCGGRTELGQALTDPAGAFTVVVKLLDTILFDPSRCFINVNLPGADCSVFPPDGVLTASLSLVNVVQSALGNIAYFTVGPFVHSVI